ncbi:MAG TPA: hypothetical protein VHP31_00180 [Caproicibacter sp.]|nr:hypothetical protein [Caproicibacter sp.]
MNIKHGDYVNYQVPEGWIVEENDELTTVYNNDGEGALTLSFYTIMEMQGTLDEHISIMAKKFIDCNLIKLHSSLILDGTNKEKSVLYGTGTTQDNWFIKIWIVAKCPKVIFATYHSEKKTSEVKIIDKIISSIIFN